MATGGANYTPEGIDRHSQLTVLLNPACAIILRSIIKYLVKLATPGGAGVTPWTLQQFLAHKRQTIESRHSTFVTTYEKLLYPADGSEPNLESWDVSLLCKFISKVCQPNPTLQSDVNLIQRIRNDLSHLSHTNISEDDYETDKNTLYVIMDRTLKMLKDDELDKCIRELKIKAAVEIPRNPDLAPIFSKLCEDNDETHKKLNTLSAECRDMHAILRRLDQTRNLETDVFMTLSKCSPEQQDSVSKTMVGLFEENVGRDSKLNSDLSQEKMNVLKDIIKQMMKNLCSNGSTVLAARQKCIAIRMRCQTIGALCDLFEQSADGTLTEMFRPIETFFRTLPGYETLEIEVNVIQRDYIRCIQQSVRRLVESEDDTRANLPVVRGVTVEQCDDESEDRRIRINLHPKTRDHLQHIQDVCSSGKLDEHLAKIAAILNSAYGSNMTIRSQLGEGSISETEKEFDTANEQEVFQAAVQLQSTEQMVECSALMQTKDVKVRKREPDEPANTLHEETVDDNADVIPLQHVAQETQHVHIQEVPSGAEADLVEIKESDDRQDTQNIHSREHVRDHDITTDVSDAATKQDTWADITKGDLEQDITQIRVENWQDRLTRLGVDSNVGNAKCDDYAAIVETLLWDADRSANRNVLSDINTGVECGDLPACLRNNEVCQKHKQPLFKLSSFAFHTLFGQGRSSPLVFENRSTDMHSLSNRELRLWLDIGLLSQDIVDTQRSKDAQIKFSHKTIQEFLAALYMSMHTDPDNHVLPIVKDVCGYIDMALKMSQVFVILSGLAPAIVNTILRYVSQVVSADAEIQQYRSSCTTRVYGRGSDRVRAMQGLMIDCVRESVDSGQTNIQAHIQDIIVDDKVFASRHIEEVIRSNKLDILSVTVDLRERTKRVESGWKILNTLISDMQSEHLNRLRTFQVVIDDGLKDTDADAMDSIIRRNQNTLTAISLCNVSSKRSPSELKFNVQSLPCLQEVALEKVVFNRHQLEHIHTLRKVKLTNITCSHCSGPCCLDLSQLAQLQCLSLARHFSGNTVNVQINTSELVECQIDNWMIYDEHTARSVTFHGEGQYLRSLSLTGIVLKHDQLVQLMLFVIKAAGLRKITLKKIKCSDCRTRCTCGLDLSRHTQLEQLELEMLDISEMQINTTQLVTCIIRRLKPTSSTSADPGSAQTSLVFHDKGNVLQHLNLTSIMLKHDQLEQVMLFVTQNTGLQYLTLNDIKCGDCSTGCTCRLDLSRHAQLRQLTIQKLHMKEIVMHTSQTHSMIPAKSTKDYAESEMISLSLEKEIHLQDLELTNLVMKHVQLEQLMLFLTQSTGLEDLTLDDIKCGDCSSECTCRLDLSRHTQLRRLTIRKLHMKEIVMHTSQTHSMIPAKSTKDYAESEMISLSHEKEIHLQDLELTNVDMKHDQFEQLLLFLTQTTRLENLTLDDIRCSDCISGCTCRLDLSRHTWLRRLELRDLHVSEVNINVTQMLRCNIERLRPACRQSEKSENIGVSLTFSGDVQHRTLIRLRDIPLRHEHLEKFEKLEDGPHYSRIRCVDCTDYCSIIGDKHWGVKAVKTIGRPKRQTELTVSVLEDPSVIMMLK